MPQSKSAKFALSDLSMDDRSQLLSRALSKEVGEYDCYLREVYDAYLVYYDYDDGGCYKVTYTIADDYTVTFGTPEAVIGRTVYEPVKMSAFALNSHLASLALGDLTGINVYPNSLLFEIDSDWEYFPGQGITVTKQDLAEIVAGFSGATMGLEHLDTVLGDACGDIRAVWLDHTGRRLFGDVAIPKGLDALIPPGPRRVSVEIFRDAEGKMSIPKVDLVLNPQIERAALMSLAAFAGNPHNISNHNSNLTPLLETRPMPEDIDKTSATEPSLWDKFKAFCKANNVTETGEPAHFAGPAVAEFRRKAALYDAAFAARRQEAKKLAVIGFDDVKAARFGKLLDDAPEGPIFDEMESQAKDAAAKIAPLEGSRRTTAPAAFGNAAQNADPAADTPRDGKAAPALESNAALFARRADETRRGSASTL